MNYTPTTDPNPKYGNSGASVKTLQEHYNNRYANTAGYTPLKVDGLYGPLTRAVAEPNLITTSSGVRQGIVKNTTELNNALSLFNLGSGQSSNTGDKSDGTKTETPDPYSSILDSMSARSDQATKALISTIQATKARKTITINDQYEKYKGGLQLLGIQHNDAQSSPELLAGHIQEAETKHLEKLSDLDAEEAKALSDAQIAKDNNDYKTLTAKISYMKEIKAEKAAALKEYYNSITQTPKIASDVSHSIYETLLTLGDKDKQTFIQAVAKQYNLPLGTLVTALNDEQGKQTITGAKVKTAQNKIDGKTTTKTTGGKISTTQITQGQQYLDSKRGSDGFTDPYEYLKAFNEFTKDKGGTVKQWVTSFPANGKGGYVNPKSYKLLPESIRPATKSGGSGQKS